MANPKTPAGTAPGNPAKPTPKPAAAATPPALPGSGPVPRLYRPVDWLTLALTTLIVMLGYLYTIAPDMTLEDSGELAVGSMYAGVPHPPGYPVWTLYSWAFTKLIPVSNIAFRVAVSSAVAAALSAGLVGLLISRGSSLILESIDTFKELERKWENPICLVSGLVGGLLIGFNGYIWSQAVIVEVYTLAVLTFMAMLAFLFRWMHAPHQRRYLYLAFFFFGLCFCNHQTLIVAAMGIQVAVALTDQKLGGDLFLANAVIWLVGMVLFLQGGLKSFHDSAVLMTIFCTVGIGSAILSGWLATRTGVPGNRMHWVLACGAAFAAGAAFYFYMPIASMSNPPMNWGYPRTWEGFIHAFTRGQYEQTNPTSDPLMFANQLRVYVEGAVEEFNYANIIIGLVPVYFLFFRRADPTQRKAITFSMVGLLVVWGVVLLASLMSIAKLQGWGPAIASVAAALPGVAYSFPLVLLALTPFLFWPKGHRMEQSWLGGLAIIYLTLAVLLMVLLNAGVDKQSRELVKVFYTSSHTVIALAAGYGLALVGAMLVVQFERFKMAIVFGAAVACCFNFYELAIVWQETVFTILRLAAALSTVVSVAFLAVVWFGRERASLTTALGIFLLIPVDSILTHWSDNEQRGHRFGFWFGHDMFEPGMDAGSPAPKGKDGKPLYPSMARDAVLFGGTDPGRFCPTYMIFCESFIPPQKRLNPKFDRRDVVLITQNALADNTYLDYIRAHYNRSAQIDPPFFYGMLNDKQSAARGRTNALASLAAPLDRFFTQLGANIEKERRAGESLFKADHFTDLNAFKARLAAAADPLSKYLKDSLGAAATGDAAALAAGLNKLLEGPSLHDDPARFAQVKLSPRMQLFAQQNPPTFNRIRMNRLLLEEAYPGLFTASPGGLYPDREIITPTVEDASRCFNDYSQDAARRYSLGQLDPGEQVTQLPDGRVSVQGQVAVMNINGLLTKIIFDANPNHEFYIEESFPLKWMYPHLVPAGIIMKIERQPQEQLTEEQMQRDHEYWSQYSARFIGNWVTYETTPKEVCDFALKTYQRRDLTGFKGDPAFVRDDNAQKAFSKLRNAIGKSIYTWRAQHQLRNNGDSQRYLKEAEFALKQAFAFCPYSPETVFNYASLLAGMGRYEDAWLVADTCYRFDRDNAGVGDLVRQLKDLKATAGAMPANKSINELADEFRANPTNVTNAFQIAGTLYQMGRSNEAVSLLDAMMTNPKTDASSLLSLAEGYRQLTRADKMADTLALYVQKSPDAPEGWFDLAALQAATGRPDEASKSLANSFRLSDTRKATNPAARDMRAVYATDPRFNGVRNQILVR